MFSPHAPFINATYHLKFKVLKSYFNVLDILQFPLTSMAETNHRSPIISVQISKALPQISEHLSYLKPKQKWPFGDLIDTPTSHVDVKNEKFLSDLTALMLPFCQHIISKVFLLLWKAVVPQMWKKIRRKELEYSFSNSIENHFQRMKGWNFGFFIYRIEQLNHILTSSVWGPDHCWLFPPPWHFSVHRYFHNCHILKAVLQLLL